MFWCTADIGWITGHTYVAYGFAGGAGATQIIFEGIPTYPNAGRFWQMIERHQCSIFYTAPTAIRSLIKAAETDEAVHPKNWNLSSLRIMGSVGEPINPEAWMWYYKTWVASVAPSWTPSGKPKPAATSSPLPGATPLVPGSCTLPLPGITPPSSMNPGRTCPTAPGGILVIKRPWPSMIRNHLERPERFKKSYFPGRTQGLLPGWRRRGAQRRPRLFPHHRPYRRRAQRPGHRMGTMEIESALVAKTDLVAEAAVGAPDDVTGEAICAFVVLWAPTSHGRRSQGEIATELRNWGQGNRPHCQAQGHPLWRQPAQDAQRQDHAPPLRSDRQGRSHHPDTSTLENLVILEQLAQTN